MEHNRQENDSFDLPMIDMTDVFEDETPEEVVSEDKEQDLMLELSESLSKQVKEELGEPVSEEEMSKTVKKGKKHIILKIIACILAVILLFASWVAFTPSGTRFAARVISSYIIKWTTKDSDFTVRMADEEEDPDLLSGEFTVKTVEEDTTKSDHRSEDYVKTYLIFGIEEILGGSNTDSMILVNINTKDKTIKLVSLLRDTLVDIPERKRNKLNSVYATQGANGLVGVIEDTYDIEISGYACVNFEGFENIINELGGVDIELTQTESNYLNKTNYISKPEYRTTVPGMNHFNGNQAMGYVRVRKVATLGGANNDYGRTVRQRRVIKAIFAKYIKSGLIDMVNMAKKCAGYVRTNISEDQMTDILVHIYENGIGEMDSMRLPYENYFWDSGKKGIGGVTYALVIDDYKDENISALHQFVFLDEPDSEEDAEAKDEIIP